MSAQTPTSHSRSAQRTASPRSTISRNHLSGCEGCILPHFRGINKAGSPFGAGKPLRCRLTSPTGQPRFPTAARPLGGKRGPPEPLPEPPGDTPQPPLRRRRVRRGRRRPDPLSLPQFSGPSRRQQQRPVPLQSATLGVPAPPPPTHRAQPRLVPPGEGSRRPGPGGWGGERGRGGKVPGSPSAKRGYRRCCRPGQRRDAQCAAAGPRRQGGAGAGRGGEGSAEPAGGSRGESRTSSTPNPTAPHTQVVPRRVYRQRLPSVPAAARRAGPPPVPAARVTAEPVSAGR